MENNHISVPSKWKKHLTMIRRKCVNKELFFWTTLIRRVAAAVLDKNICRMCVVYFKPRSSSWLPRYKLRTIWYYVPGLKMIPSPPNYTFQSLNLFTLFNDPLIWHINVWCLIKSCNQSIKNFFRNHVNHAFELFSFLSFYFWVGVVYTQFFDSVASGLLLYRKGYIFVIWL